MIGGAISSGVGAIVGGGKGLEIATSMLRGGKEGLKSGKFFGSIGTIDEVQVEYVSAAVNVNPIHDALGITVKAAK